MGTHTHKHITKAVNPKTINPDTVIHAFRATLHLVALIATGQTGEDASDKPPALSALMLPTLDLDNADPFLVRALGQHLDSITGLACNSARAIGHLLAVASPEIEGGEFSQTTIEGLGWTLAELGDAGSWATVLAQRCKMVTADFEPHEEFGDKGRSA